VLSRAGDMALTALAEHIGRTYREVYGAVAGQGAS
jgi:hypothetical protein